MKKIIKRKNPIIKVELDEYKDNFIFHENSNTISYMKLEEHGFKENEDFEYVEYGNEGHGSSGDMSGAIRSLKLLDDFLYRKIESK